MHPEKQKLKIESVYITENERRSAQISHNNLQSGLEEFHKNGLVILENAIGLPALNHVRERMLQDIPQNLASPRVHYNHGKEHRNVSQTPPLLTEYLHEEIWANRFAITLIEHIIGPRPQLSYATSNIALPGGQGRQGVHSDYYCSHLDFPVFLEACIFLDDISSQNGSTEIWLGTHYGYNKRDHAFPDMGWIKREVFTERAKICPPFQPSIPKGSICIRDLRLWHAGMPNLTSVPRIMIGLIYSPKWFGSHMRLRFPIEARKRIESWEHVDCLSVAEFVEDDLDYLEFRQELNLTQEKSDIGSEYVPKHGTVTAGPEHYWSTTAYE
jgi:ectoine hydroxylase-related dioxygenase (phytanoyl-CoA dioxygenase family)